MVKYFIGDRQGFYEAPYGGIYWVSRIENGLIIEFLVDLTRKKYFGLVSLVKKKDWDRVEGFLISNKAKIITASILTSSFGGRILVLDFDRFKHEVARRCPDFDINRFL